MHEGPVSPRHASAIQHGPERRARWYLFAVCCGAMFLLSIVLGNRPSETEPLCAALVLPASQATGASAVAESPVDEIRSAEQIASAVRPFISAQHPQSELVSHFTRETSATLSPIQQSGIQRLMVSYVGQRPEAVKVLNSLVENYAAQLRIRRQQASERAYQQAVDKVTAAKSYATAAGDRLTAKRTSATTSAARGAHDASNSETSLPKLRIEPNPAWVDLSKQLHDAEQLRRELLTQLNEVHPRVKDVQYKIAAIRQQLSGVPETLTQVGGDVAQQQSADANQALAIKLARLENDYQTAQLAQQNAEQELSAAQQQLAQATVDPTRVVLWAAPAQPASSGAPTVIFGFLLAVVTAGGIAFVAVPENPTFRTVELAADTLPVPVVGVIHTTEKTPWLEQTELPRWTRVVQRSAEGVLMIAVVVGTLYWLSGTELAARVAGGIAPSPSSGARGDGR